MPSPRTKDPKNYVALLNSLTPRAYRARRTVALLLAISPPLLCALFATGPDRWTLFERSGSLTAAIGLLLASREYLRPGLIQLAISKQKQDPKTDVSEQLEDIYTHKMGLAVSAFGSVVMGWGSYLQWWAFSYLAIWAVLAAYDAWRDFVRLRRTPGGDSVMQLKD
jgi:hypothetical protein